MKRSFLLWVGLLAFALMPALAQTPPVTGKIHGHVTLNTTLSATKGSVSLSNDDGHTSKYTFPVDENGDYAGEAAPGTYMLIFRDVNTPKDKMVDSYSGVKVIAGQEVLQNIDMSRKEFIDAMSEEDRKQLAEVIKKNAGVMKENEVIKRLNADIKTASADFHDCDNAMATAIAALGATAAKADLDAKAIEIKTAKYTEVEGLMLKDTEARPTESALWADLGQAQKGLKKFDDAATAYKKVLDLEATSKKPNPQAQGAANEGLGEINARQGKIAEANAAYDAAAKANPPQAIIYLKNEAVIFYQASQTSGDAKTIAAQVAAADEAIAANTDPNNPNTAILYYLKGQGMISAPDAVKEDPQTHKLTAPPGAIEAFQKYLALTPTGQFANDVKGILAGFNETIQTSVKVPKKK
jgi:tetratricopeptide (TPR) repeat protein